MKRILTLLLFSGFLVLICSESLMAANPVLLRGSNPYTNTEHLSLRSGLSGNRDVSLMKSAGYNHLPENDTVSRFASNSTESIRGGIFHAGTDSVSSVDMYDDEFYDDEFYMNDFGLGGPYLTISDPLEPVNRIFFHFNDKLYFWVLRPAARGYKVVVPTPARRGVRNFFKNITFPVRFVSCIFQGKFEGAGHELGRFLINSTLGVAGFMDTATKSFNIPEHNQDLGLTLGSYGLGHGFFINWPFLGPSSARDSLGSAGGIFLNPVHHVDMATKYKAALRGFETVNSTSLSLGDYETLKNASLDHYSALRDAYFQYRQKQSAEK